MSHMPCAKTKRFLGRKLKSGIKAKQEAECLQVSILHIKITSAESVRKEKKSKNWNLVADALLNICTSFQIDSECRYRETGKFLIAVILVVLFCFVFEPL